MEEELIVPTSLMIIIAIGKSLRGSQYSKSFLSTFHFINLFLEISLPEKKMCCFHFFTPWYCLFEYAQNFFPFLMAQVRFSVWFLYFWYLVISKKKCASRFFWRFIYLYNFPVGSWGFSFCFGRIGKISSICFVRFPIANFIFKLVFCEIIFLKRIFRLVYF